MSLEFKPLPPASILGFTGHRPPRLGGYNQETYSRLYKLACLVLDTMKPARVVSGMALGWDTEVAFAAVMKRIPLVAAVPFRGQESVWPADQQARYHRILEKAETVTIVSEGDYSAQKLLDRNLWICDTSTHMAALWDGTSGGGTYHCLGYAKHCRIPVIQLWDLYRTLEV